MSIDTPHFIQYKFHMNRTILLLSALVALAISACQAAPTPLPTSTPTVTAGPPPTATPSPTSTHLPTPVPVVRVDSGDRALFYGEYDQAREQYQTALNESTDRAVQAAALWGLGRTDIEDGKYKNAIDILEKLITEYPESTYAARANFLVGQA